jgi:hypothetical protein
MLINDVEYRVLFPGDILQPYDYVKIGDERYELIPANEINNIVALENRFFRAWPSLVNADLPPTDKLKAIEIERGKVYGPPKSSHANIGLSWTGLIQQHYGITLDHPIPDFLVALMLDHLKGQRSCRVFKQDNYDDKHIYADFAERFQQGKE